MFKFWTFIALVQLFTTASFGAGSVSFEFLPVDESYHRGYATMLAPGCISLNRDNQNRFRELASSFIAFTPRAIWRNVGRIHVQVDPNSPALGSYGSRSEDPFILQMRVCKVLNVEEIDAIFAHEFAHGIFRYQLIRRNGKTENVSGVNELWADFFAAAWSNDPEAASLEIANLSSDSDSASIHRDLRRFVNNMGPTASQRLYLQRIPTASHYFISWEIRNLLWSKYQERVSAIGRRGAFTEIFNIFLDIAATLSERADVEHLANTAVTQAMIPMMRVRLEYLGN